MNGFDDRLLSVTFGVGQDKFHTYDQNFNLKVNVQKDILGKSNTATIELMNISEDDRNFLVGGFSAWRKRKFGTPFVPVEVMLGRESTGLEKSVYLGCVVQSSMSMPPDINVTIHCTTSQNAKLDLSAEIPHKGTLKSISEWAAKLLRLDLSFHAADQRIITSPQKLWSIEALPGMLNWMFAATTAIYIDDNKLVVRDLDKALNGNPIKVDVTSGLVGIPALTEWGVNFTAMADRNIPLSSAVELASIKNPSSVVLYLPVPAFATSVALFCASSVKPPAVPKEVSKQPSSLAGSLVLTEFNQT